MSRLHASVVTVVCCVLASVDAAARPRLPFEYLDAHGTITAHVVADLNGDGRQDAAVGSVDTPGIDVFLNRGAAEFDHRFLDGEGFPSALGMAAGDVDGDGIVDLVVVQVGASLVVLSGRGDGSFVARPGSALPIFTWVDPVAVRLADLDDDGKLDVVVSTGYEVLVLRATGPAAFEPHGVFGGDDWDQEQIEVVDVDGDGVKDLLRASPSLSLELRLGTGDCDFGAPHVVLDGVSSFALADVDGDGVADVIGARTTFWNPSMVIARGLGTGAFGPPEARGPIARLFILSAEDFDGDGHVDVIAGEPNGDWLRVFRGRAGGEFEEPSLCLSHSRVIEVTRLALDDDSWPDFIFVHEHASVLTAARGGKARLFLTGGLSELAKPARAVAAGDLDGDGDLDVMFASEDFAARLNDGTGVFTLGSTTRLGGTFADIQLADLDRDGRLDIVLMDWNSTGVTAWRNLGDGRFIWTDSLGGGPIATMAVADFDGDATPDVVLLRSGFASSARLGFARGRGDGTFEDVRWSGYPAVFDASAADFDQDGRMDLLLATTSNQVYSLLRGRGDGTFDAPEPIGCGPDSAAAVPLDLDHDGDPDLICETFNTPGTYDQTIRLLENTGGAHFRERWSWHGFATGSHLVVGDLNDDGWSDLVVQCQQGGVYVFESEGPFSLSLPSHFDADIPDGGVIGDFTGDGKADLLGVSWTRNFLYPNLGTGPPAAPVADAGVDQVLECGSPDGTVATLDGGGSTDVNSTPGTNDDIVTWLWSSDPIGATAARRMEALFPMGTHSAGLTVTDRTSLASTDDVLITVRDTLPPAGTIDVPVARSCHGGPVVVAADFHDVCDAAPVLRFTPEGGPTYSSPGDHVVTVTARDASGNESSASVEFTIDLVAPTVALTVPAHWTLPSLVPISSLFQCGDDDGAAGGVVHEVVRVAGCAVLDGDVDGDGDGLLSDESLVLDTGFLCRAAERCGWTTLERPQVRVEATDCAGNTGVAEVTAPSVVRLRPGLCARRQDLILTRPAGGRGNRQSLGATRP